MMMNDEYVKAKIAVYKVRRKRWNNILFFLGVAITGLLAFWLTLLARMNVSTTIVMIFVDVFGAVGLLFFGAFWFLDMNDNLVYDQAEHYKNKLIVKEHEKKK